jgi:hypothetical protein
MNLEQFYQAFKKNKAERIKKITNFEDFLKKNKEESEHKDIWNKYEIVS